MGCGIANKDGPGPDCLPSLGFHAYNISTASLHWTAMAQPAIMGNSNLDWHESLYSTPSTAQNPATLFVWQKRCRWTVTGHTATKADLIDLKVMPVRRPRQERHHYLSWQNHPPELSYHMQHPARIRNYMTKPSWGGTSFTWGVATATLPVEQFVSAAICRFRSTPIVVASDPQIELELLGICSADT